MPFVPLQPDQAAKSWKVSPQLQAARDSDAEQLVAQEFDQAMPAESRVALEADYRQRFNKEPPTAQEVGANRVRHQRGEINEQGLTPANGFVPLDGKHLQKVSSDQPDQGFIPLSPEQPSILKTVALENPLAAIGETGLNLASQSVALPVAGLAGLATEAGRALGITDKSGADVVHSVGEAMTYQPRGAMGKAATEIATYPFQKLAEAGQWAGGKTLEATGSPLAATAVDTAINSLPMLVTPAAKGAKAAPKVGPVVPTTPKPIIDPAAGPLSKAAVTSGEATKYVDAGLAATPEKQTGFLPLGEGVVFPDPLLSDTNVKPQAIAEPPAQGFTPTVQEHANAHEVSGRTRRLEADDQSLPGYDRQGLQELRGTGDYGLPGMAGELQDVSGLRGDQASRGSIDLAGAPGYQRPLSAGERGMGGAPAADYAPPILPPDSLRGKDFDHSGSRAVERNTANDLSPSHSAATDWSGDGRNAGPAALPEGLQILDIQRRDLERAGMGEALGDSNAQTALTIGEGHATGDGIAARRSEAVSSGFTPLEDVHKTAKTAVSDVAPGDLLESNRAMMPGTNYVGLIDGAEGRAGISLTDKPIRREDVLRPLSKALGVPLYQGRVQGKALGTYTPKKEVIRLKNANDIEVAAHEIAHFLDDRIPEIRETYKADKAIAAELRGVSYDKTKLHEGFAEFVRLWSTQPEKAKALTPKAHEWFETLVNSHEHGPALRAAQEGMTSWFGQDALHRAQSKIGTTKSINEAVDGAWDKFRQSVSDDLAGVYKMERDLTGKINPVGAYETARLTRAANSVTEGAVRYGRPVKKPDGSFTYEGKGLEKILDPIADRLDDFLLYAVGRSAKELMGQNREHLFTRPEIDAMLNLKQDGFEKAFMQYQAWNKGILDFAEAHGVINPEARKMWQRSAYLPFHRVGQAGEARSAKPGEWSGVRALTGGTDNIRDVLGNIIGNAATLMEKAIQNDARLKIAKLADEEVGGGRFMVKVPTESRPVRIDAKQVASEVMKKLGIDLQKALPPEAAALQSEILKHPQFFDFMMGGQTPAGSNIVAVMRNGKREFYEVGDPVLYRSLMAMDREPPHWVTRWLSVPKRLGQATITLTPDFMVANIVRDTLMGAVMSRAGFRPIMDSLQGMRLRLTNDPVYKDFIANGGGLSSMLLDEKRLRHHLERFYGHKGVDYRTVLDSPDKLLYGIETIADAFEMSTRLGEYKRAIDRGEHPRHAAYLGREVSTDFAMKGDSKALGFLYDTVMFLRPMVSSFDRLYRGLAHDENRGAIATKTGLLAMSSMALYMANKDNPEFQDLPEWDRDGHWHFFVPTPSGETVHLRYPKIWEIGAVASVAERSLERLLKDDPSGLGKDVGRILGTTFHFNLMPQAVAPLYQQATNRNSFTGSPIETPGMENLQPFLRAKPSTSETMKALGMASRKLPESMQLNPARAEALVRGYFNTWAMYGLMASDEALYGERLPERRMDQMPVVRRFYEGQPAIHIRHEEMFYDILGEAKRLHGTLRALDKTGNANIADEMESEPMASMAGQIERAAKHVHSINEEIKQVTRADVTREEKRKRIDALMVERNQLMKQTVEEIKPSPGSSHQAKGKEK